MSVVIKVSRHPNANLTGSGEYQIDGISARHNKAKLLLISIRDTAFKSLECLSWL
jgi:hypothetical protein